MPFYSDNSGCFNFSHIVPVSRDMFALYVHPNIALLFKEVWDITNNRKFIIGDILESEDDLDCKNFDKRLSDFNPYRKARIKRTLEGIRDSIFFDEDEIDFLEGLFNHNNFTAIVSIYIKGQEYELPKLDSHIYSIIKPFIDDLQLVEQIECDEYRKAYRHEGKGVRAVLKDKVLLKHILPGLLLIGTGIALTFTGYKKSLDSIDISVQDEAPNEEESK